MKLSGLKTKIGKLLKEKGYERSVSDRIRYTRGYRFDSVDYSKRNENVFMVWENGGMTALYNDQNRIQTIHSILVDNGLGEYVELADEIIRLKNYEL